MKKKKINSIILFALIAVSLALLAAPSPAQNGNNGLTPNDQMIYHNGPVMQGTSNIYFIWYGCWDCGYAGSNSETQAILIDLAVNLGSSPYFKINTTYPDANGFTPSGGLIYGGSPTDPSYAHGRELTAADIRAIIADSLAARNLPVDPAGAYIVVGSADISSEKTGFCAISTPPHHGYFEFGGTQIKYAFVGNAARCPLAAAPQFFAPDGSPLPSPNGNLAADGMASTMAHALAVMVTNPTGTGWFNRYGMENADQCQASFGQTYMTANGARANMRLGQRDYLIQQNWVNVGRGYCGLSHP